MKNPICANFSPWLVAVILCASQIRGGEFSGTIAEDTTWRASDGPYVLTGTVNINSGVTLTIEPGTSVDLGRNVDLIVKNGGRLLAEGTAVQPIQFTRSPGATARWGDIIVNGSAGSPETRIIHAHIEGNKLLPCLSLASIARTTASRSAVFRRVPVIHITNGASTWARGAPRPALIRRYHSTTSRMDRTLWKSQPSAIPVLTKTTWRLEPVQ